MAIRSLVCGLVSFAPFTIVTGNIIPRSSSISFQDGIVAEAGGMHNVHITYSLPLNGPLSLHYGSCELDLPEDSHHTLGKTHVGSHPLAKRHIEHPEQRPTRFVWLPPKDISSGGCLHAFSENVLVGRSAPVTVTGRKKSKRWIAAADIMDAEGPWFDGVVHLAEKEPDEVFVASAKSKTIGIIGGGMSGLMTSHLLDSVGFYDWKIIEASARIGGRVHTAYLNGTRPDQYQYMEMGPMRFPLSITDPETGEKTEILDHRMVFQLAAVINDRNGNSSEYEVKFIPWIQSAAGDPAGTSHRRPDGTIPSVAEVSAIPAYRDNLNLTYSNATAVALASQALDKWTSKQTFKSLAKNVYKAHKLAVEQGYFHFSEAGYLRYHLGISANITDQVDSISDNDPTWLYDDGYFSAGDWRTIDQGLTKLPAAFGPLVFNRTIFQTAVDGMIWNETTQKMAITYRNGNPFDIEPETMEFDYVVVAAPFTKVRLWRLPDYTSLLSRAIQRLNYDPSCKIALRYKTRFWEHLEHPIFGGCGSTNIPQLGSVCYPPYNINSTGPGVILASYVSGTGARSVGALSDEHHVALVQRAMIEIHGKIAQEQFTGSYDRHCWEFDEFQAGAWASPLVGQQDLYLPAYFHTEKHTVFVGEHTSYTHAWIWSALESAVRGTTQLLLDMGLVDEAKEIVDFWMARWISV